ncbi:hypothetical protein Tco_1485832 [Tanacetum coccineum]
MANIRSCNKHNMIACVEKTAQNADFYQIIDFLTGCSINYSLLVDPDLIGPSCFNNLATATLQVINDVPHIRAKVAGKKILISEATIRADLLFDDENGVDCFPKQVIWDTLRDIGYEGNLAQLTFSKPLFSPQWKYLVHVLLHCLSPKSTSWEQFGTNIASALVGLATNQKFNFSLMILTGMLGHISNGTPFLMYPRFVQLFLNKQLEGDYTLYNPLMIEVSQSIGSGVKNRVLVPQSRATRLCKGCYKALPLTVPAHSQRTASVQGAASFQGTATSQGTAPIQRTADFQGTAEPHDAASIPKSPNDYTPTDASQTSGGDEGLLEYIKCFEQGSRRLRSKLYTQQTNTQAQSQAQEELSKILAPVVKHHAHLWVEECQTIKKQKETRNKNKKKYQEMSIPGPTNSTQQPNSRALETTNDEEVARKIQAEWDAEEERKRFEELKKTKPKTTLRKPTSLAQERNQMMRFPKETFVPRISEKVTGEMLKKEMSQRLSRNRKATIIENAQDKESLEGISMITELQVIDSPDGEYLIIHRANNHFRAFDTLWEILHVLRLAGFIITI